MSVDIDEDIVANAGSALAAAGYRQVTVVCADGEYGYESGGPYDAVLVTVNASDVPRAWQAQVATGGRLVVPLRMRGNTRCLTLQRHDDHLVATASMRCGFVPMQGDGRDPARRVALRGDDAVLMLDDLSTQVCADARTASHRTRPHWSRT